MATPGGFEPPISTVTGCHVVFPDPRPKGHRTRCGGNFDLLTYLSLIYPNLQAGVKTIVPSSKTPDPERNE